MSFKLFWYWTSLISLGRLVSEQLCSCRLAAVFLSSCRRTEIAHMQVFFLAGAYQTLKQRGSHNQHANRAASTGLTGTLGRWEPKSTDPSQELTCQLLHNHVPPVGLWKTWDTAELLTAFLLISSLLPASWSDTCHLTFIFEWCVNAQQLHHSWQYGKQFK